MHQKQPPAKVAFLNAWSSGWGALRACPPAAGENRAHRQGREQYRPHYRHGHVLSAGKGSPHGTNLSATPLLHHR